MPTPVEDIAAQALGLPPEDRAKLVERLLESFEPRSPAPGLVYGGDNYSDAGPRSSLNFAGPTNETEISSVAAQ